mgnify:CR=1 FL=1
MKPGSLVVVTEPVDATGFPGVEWLPVGDNETPYVIREIVEYPLGTAVLFEEGVIGRDPKGEIALSIEIVREIQPPEEVSISALMEEVNEIELFAV